ncbi:MAG: hypothetical protein EP335_08535 [Alphaproteobacteria bacterium]|nr:MAG: hypothetical protein EP335_08535 [Alphaproteobacteria bacterium]
MTIAQAYMPEYPVVPTTERQHIAARAAGFIRGQLALQPFYIALPLRILSIMLYVLMRLFGRGVLRLVARMPGGDMVERFYRSLVSLCFFENAQVLATLNQIDPETRLSQFRARFADKA